MKVQIIQNNFKMFKFLITDWSADIAIYDEREKSIMKEATNELASLNYSLNIGSEGMPIEEYVQLVWEEIVDA